MLDKDEIREQITLIAGDVGCQLAQMRRARGLRLCEVGRATGLSADEIDRIENWMMNTMNMESVIRLAAFYDKRLYMDFRSYDEAL